MLGRHTYLKFVLFVALIGFDSSAIAGSPQAQLQDTMDRVLALTQTFHSEADFIENKTRLRQIIFPRFDFAEMARRSMGKRWDTLVGKQAEFIAAFIQFAENSYMNALGSYRGERVTYGQERTDADFAEVDTQIVGPRETTQIVYKLHLVADEWKVYDVIIDQISLVSNFRSQFGRVLQTASVDELMRRLRAKGTER